MYWILGLLIGCTYSETELNSISELDRTAVRTIENWSPKKETLALNGLSSLTVDDARLLASWHPTNNLINLPPEVVDWLKPTHEEYLESKGDLWSLKVLEYVETPTIAIAGSYPAIELNGLSVLTPDIAAEFAKSKRPLEFCLNGLTTVDAETIHALADGSWYGELHLDGISTITPEVAKEMTLLQGRWYDGVVVHLRGIKEWSVETLIALQPWKMGELYIRPKTLTVEQAKAIVGMNLSSLTIEDVQDTVLVTEEIQTIFRDAPFTIRIMDIKDSLSLSSLLSKDSCSGSI